MNDYDSVTIPANWQWQEAEKFANCGKYKQFATKLAKIQIGISNTSLEILEIEKVPKQHE